MASTYSPTLRTELPATGDQNNAWATTVDNNLNVPIEQGLAGLVTVNIPDANVTLTTANAAADQARATILVFTGALSADRTVIAPQVPKMYIVRNNTTGGKNVLLRTGAPSSASVSTGYPFQYGAVPYSGSSSSTIPVPGVIIPPNSTTYVYTDGTLFDYCINSLPGDIAADSVTFPSALPIASGGTAATTAAGARTNLGLGSAATLDAATPNTANTAVLRDGTASFSANVITAGLNGAATNTSNTNLLGGLPPPSYSGVNTNWQYQLVYGQVAINGPTTIDMASLVGNGPCLIEWSSSGTFYLQGFYVIADGTASVAGVNLPTAIGQYFNLGSFGQLTNIYKLRKIF